MAYSSPTLRIFVSSPGDVAHERRIARETIERLAAEFASRLVLEPYFWEYEPFDLSKSFQAQIPNAADFDLLLCFLWSRLGSRLHSSMTLPDGTQAPTGTEYEISYALDAQRKRNGLPEIQLWINQTVPAISPEPPEVHDEMIAQWRAVKHFIEERTRDSSEGTFVGSYNGYRTLAEFEELLEAKLRRTIQKQLEALGAAASPQAQAKPTWLLGSPFRSLQAFELAHAKVFFGRTKAIGEAIGSLRRNLIDPGDPRGFLLVLGASGSGKSSLARAGILPALLEPGVIDGVGYWRRAVLTPSDGLGDLFGSLANALLADAALPELREDGLDPKAFAARIAASPTALVESIIGGLRQAAAVEQLRQRHAMEETARRFEAEGRVDDAAVLRAQIGQLRPLQTRLLILVDQLEEFFEIDSSPESRHAFIGALAALARSGRVIVLSTLRSDFFPRCSAEPELVKLMNGAGTYVLQPPTAAELGQIVRHPALAAGLRFEQDPATHERLDDILRDAAVRDPDALPLLEFTLDALYEARSPDGLLTLGAYRALGGVEGAVARRAEEAYSKLSPASQAAFDQVFGMLVRLRSDDATGAVRSRIAIKLVSNTPERKAFVDAFVAARLLISDRSDTGEPILTIAHEALLRAWPRLSGWIERNRDLLQCLGRVNAAADRWERDQQDADLLLPEGRLLFEAEDLVASFAGNLPGILVEYVRRSRARAEHRSRQRIRRLQVLVCVFALLAAVAAGAGAVALREKSNTVRTLSQSDFLQGVRLASEADGTDALAYLTRSLAPRPSDTAISTLITTLLTYRNWMVPRAVLRHDDTVRWAEFSPDGGRIVTASWDNRVRVWNAANGSKLWESPEHKKQVQSAHFSSDGTRVVTASDDGIALILDASTGAVLTRIDVGYKVATACFNPSGTLVVTGSWNNVAQIWDARTGIQRGETMRPRDKGFGVVASACFSRDGTRIVTASWDHTARIWDASRGGPDPLVELRAGDNEPSGPIRSAEFSPDGTRVLTASDNHSARIWDTTTGRPVGKVMPHEGLVQSAHFSPDGRLVVTASDDGTACVWDGLTGEPVTAPSRHKGLVRTALFSPDGSRFVTASGDATARIWDAHTGLPLSEPMKHGGGVETAFFSPDGTQVLTAAADNAARIWEPLGAKALCLSLKPAVEQHPPSPPWPDASSATDNTVPRFFAQLSPDGRRVATASDDGTVRIWDAMTGALLAGPMRHGGGVQSVCFSADGNLVATASDDGKARVWDSRTGQLRGSPMEHAKPVRLAVFSPDGSRLATASGGGRLESGPAEARIWNLASGKSVLAPLSLPHAATVASVAFSPDGAWVATASWDATARIWSADTGKPLPFVLQHDGKILRCAEFSPDGVWLVTAGDDGTARIWNARTGKARIGPLKVNGLVQAAHFNSDGTRVVTATWDDFARVWDPQTGVPVTEPLKHGGWVQSARFSPDGTLVVTASDDKTAQIWDSRSGQPLSDPFPLPEAVRVVQFSADGKRVLTASQDRSAQIWDVAPAGLPPPDWLLTLAEVVSGQVLTQENIMKVTALDQGATLGQLRRRLEQSQSQDDWTVWGRWFLADPATRTISPFSRLSVPELRARQVPQLPATSAEGRGLAPGAGLPIAGALTTDPRRTR